MFCLRGGIGAELENDRCKACPLKWYSKERKGTCHELYCKWVTSITWDKKYKLTKRYARMIRNAVPKDGKVNRKRMIQWAEKLTVRPAKSAE